MSIQPHDAVCQELSMISRKSVVASLFLLSCLTLATASFASSDTDFSNSGGTLTGTSAGLSLTGSTLVAVNGYNGDTDVVASVPEPGTLVMFGTGMVSLMGAIRRKVVS